MRRLICVLIGLPACQVQGGGGDEGLIVISDTAQVGPPPACNDDPPTTGAGESESEGGSESESGGEALVGSGVLSRGTASSRAPDPGTTFCAKFTSEAACDDTPRMDGDTLVGECKWVTVVPVLPGTCDATQLYGTCVHVPATDGPCELAQSCGQVGLGIYGRTGCDGTVEVIVVPPGQAFCAAPTDWPLCWPDDESPECTCVCT